MYIDIFKTKKYSISICFTRQSSKSNSGYWSIHLLPILEFKLSYKTGSKNWDVCLELTWIIFRTFIVFRKYDPSWWEGTIIE